MKELKFAGAAGITGIGTSIPKYQLKQNEVFQRIEESCKKDSDVMRWARRIFRQCGVDTRYTCEPDFLKPAGACRYLPDHEEAVVPSTSERMEVYQRESVPLAAQAAREAMTDAKLAPSSVTHLITVSCTGQFLPGLDTLLIKDLELSRRINRIPLTFQGCSAGLKAIQLAKSIVESDSSHHVLVVCVELCTIHFQPPASREALFGASFFGDGASACIISAVTDAEEHVFQLGSGHSVLIPDSVDEMIWNVGNQGFDLYLSPAIPKLLKSFLREEVGLLLGDHLPPLWAIHPGGRGIVDAVQDMFMLDDSQVAYSRDILKHYGNLSSVTILFVLKRMREDLVQQGKEQANGISLAFGPGLTAELLSFSYISRTEKLHSSEKDAAYV
ncbi:type III polyketide synthase [Paenibacillus dokdonensis]|uniref:Type III polyketide synthase n=1 Tax=Paenibacillus dokdonensis TaxID=2567944 RepID=A0ABU6GIS5_9BACL|nr:type III polyketide synthase [Paenibacillus dokdonensis]MEC0239660.1 type III polyketide synthase [Paenibacillus dokdonensis]